MTMPIDPATGLPSGLTINLPPPTPVPENAPRSVPLDEVYALIEKARQEEKDKLYPRLEEVETALRAQTQEREAQQAEQARLEQEAAEAQRLAQEAEMTALQRLEASNTTWEEKFVKWEEERAIERAVMERERQYTDLMTFRDGRIQQEINAHAVAPQFADFIRGNTPEEIETSIELAKVKTEELAAEFRAVSGAPPVAARPGLPISGMPPVDMPGGGGVLGSGEQIILTPEQIRNMTAEEFAANRQGLLAAASQRVQAGGLYAP